MLFGNKEIKKGQLFNFENIEKKTSIKSAVSGNDYAVILSGGNETRFRNDCAAFYSALKAIYGYTDDRIFVLVGDGSNYGSVVNDYAATLSNISTVFTTLGSKITSNDRLVVFAMDHGGQNSGNNVFMCLQNNELLPDFILADEINKINASSITVIIGSCNSGGFTDNLSKDKRTIATACKYDESSYSTADNLYDEFNYHFISAILGKTPSGSLVNGDENGDGKVSLREAFYYAKGHDATKEAPQYNSRPALLGKTTTLNSNNATTNAPSAITYNLDFNYNGGDRSLCNPFKVNPELFHYAWDVSHGSPKVHQQYQLAYMEAIANDFTDIKGEGIFIGFKFFGGHKYSILLSGDDTYEGTIPGGYANTVFLAAKAANGLNIAAYSDCDKEKTPACTSSKTLYDSFGPDGVIPNRLANVSSDQIYFNPDEKFDQLWLYAYQRSIPATGAVYLSNSAITDYGVSVPETDEAKVYTPGTTPNMVCCNQELPAAGGTPSKTIGTNISGSFQWSASNDNVSWSIISGATGKDYQIGSIVPPKYYKRMTTDGSYESNIITISKAAPIPLPNVICTPGRQIGCNSTNWQISHGDPIYGSDTNIGSIVKLKWGFEPNLINPYRTSDGIFTSYNFKKGKQYIISFYIYTTSYQSCENALLVKAVSGLNIHPGDNKVVNTTADKSEQIFSGNGEDNKWTKMTLTYTPNDDYEKIWIYPSQKWSCYSGTNWKYAIGKFAIMIDVNTIGPLIFTQSTSEEGKNIATSGNVTLNSGINVSFIADETISLKPEFNTKPGTYFSAKIADIYTECYNSNEIIYKSSDFPPYSEFEHFTPSSKTSTIDTENKKGTVEILVYPNPNNGEFIVELSGVSNIITIELVDLSGRILFRKDNINKKSTDVNISYMPSGTYFIKVITKDSSYMKHIIKT